MPDVQNFNPFCSFRKAHVKQDGNARFAAGSWPTNGAWTLTSPLCTEQGQSPSNNFIFVVKKSLEN